MVRSVKDLTTNFNGRACIAYDELKASPIEIESVINAKPLSYTGKGADDSLPVTPHQYLTNRRSTCVTPKPAVNLLFPAATLELFQLDKDRKDYVSNICARFIAEYLIHLDNLQTKRKSGKRIRLVEVVPIRDEDSKRPMWSTGLVKELRPSRNGLLRSTVLKTPTD